MPLQLCPCTFIPRPHPLHNWNEHLLFTAATSTSVIPAHSCVCVCGDSKLNALHILLSLSCKLFQLLIQKWHPDQTPIMLLQVRMSWFGYRTLICLLYNPPGIRNVHRFQKLNPLGNIKVKIIKVYYSRSPEWQVLALEVLH